MLKSDEFDFAIILTFSYTHTAIALDFLRAGKNVLITKPWAITTDEADSIIKTAAENNCIVMPFIPCHDGADVVKLKELIKDGRWEPEGSMFVECDCNLSSGESLVRQILYGKRYFKEEFGKESRILFLPDVFGYSAAMPQILKKSGVDYFITSKISWNDTNTMPHDSFIWKGIDGTEIFTNFINAFSNSP